MSDLTKPQNLPTWTPLNAKTKSKVKMEEEKHSKWSILNIHGDEQQPLLKCTPFYHFLPKSYKDQEAGNNNSKTKAAAAF